MTSHLVPLHPKISHQAAWVVGCRIVGIVCTIASNMLVSRLLGPAGYGAFLIATSILAFGCLLALGGLSEAGLRFVSESLGLRKIVQARAYLLTTLQWAISSSIIATSFVLAFLLLLRRFGGPAEFNLFAILLVGLGVLVLTWQQLTSQLLRGLNDLRSASFYSGGQTGGPLSNLIFIFPISLAWYCWVPLTTTQIIGLLVGSICVTLPIAFWELSRTGRFRFHTARDSAFLSLSPTQKREFTEVAVSFLGIQVLAFVATQSDLWIGMWILDSEELGLYGAVKRGLVIAQMPLQMALMSIQGSIPSFYAQGRYVELERNYRTAISLAAIPAFASIILFLVFPSEVLTVICGNSFSSAAPMVAPLAVGLIALLFFGSPGDVLAMTGNHRLVLRVNAISAMGLIAFGTLAAAKAGPVGLAMSSSLVYAGQNAILWWMAKKKLGIWTHIRYKRSSSNP